MSHTRASSLKPHERSTAAFLNTSHEMLILQEGPALPLWIPPPDLSTVEPRHQRYWEMQMPALQLAEDYRRSVATTMLDKVARPELIGKYDHPDMSAIAEDLIQLQRLAYKMFSDTVEQLPEAPQIRPANAIIFCIKASFKAKNPGRSDNYLNDTTAKLLSRGIPIGEALRYGSNRNHVRRAEQAFKKSVNRIANYFEGETRENVVTANLRYWSDRVATLLALEAGAAKDPRFRGLSGKALAEAIDQHPGMLTAYLRQNSKEAA